MTFRIKINHRNAIPCDYAKTEYLAKRTARLMARRAAKLRFLNNQVVDIIYVEDCLGGLRAEYRVDDTRYIMSATLS